VAAPASEPVNSLGELRSVIQAEIDNEISARLIDVYVNLEIQYLSTRREFNHFFKRTTGTLKAKNPDGVSILELPDDLKKTFSITSRDQNLTGDTAAQAIQEFRQGYHYELFWNETRKAFDAHFDTVQNTTDLTVQIDYYVMGSRLLNDSEFTRIATFYTNVIILGVLKRCYRKLGDLNEWELTDRDYKEAVQAMIDDDAREHDLPQVMSPSRHQGREEYERELDKQKYVESTFWQRYQ
jgi:hypothetical protein